MVIFVFALALGTALSLVPPAACELRPDGLRDAIRCQVQDSLRGQHTSAPVDAKIWLRRHGEFEEFLRTAPIRNVKQISIGVTKPRRAHFEPGGLAQGAVIKNLKPGRAGGYWESYRSEIAAYELDKLLGLEMVPPYVERRINGDLMAIGLWVEPTEWLKTRRSRGERSPDVLGWNRQVYRQRVFDNLIANLDRNEGNLLVDPAWNLILIDHTRAFTSTMKMPFDKEMTRIDRPFFERLKGLQPEVLEMHLARWLPDRASFRSLLARRTRIVAYFEKLIAAQGEAAVLLP
jgi:hypothetical protein